LLPKEATEDVEEKKVENVPYAGSTINSDANEGLPWFETMVQGSKLGNVRRSWGSRHSGNGRIKVEWEIMEWTDENENENTSPVKRKIGEVEESDLHMEGGH
jgi:hypothetical protein